MLSKILVGITFLITTSFAQSQTQTPVYFSSPILNSNSKGFYRYLPADYSTSTKNYPLIIWIHGAAQIGDGSTANLPKILLYGLPNVISKGQFPASFNSGDSSYSFVVISPQFNGNPTGSNVTAIINYVVSNYRINQDRIYLMGMSAGGAAVWDNASISVANSDRLAAIIPFAGNFWPSQALANRIAQSNLPVWAFHNTNDGTVPVSYSRNWRTYINNYNSPRPNPLAKLTEFPVQSSDAVIAHDCWTNTTVPTYKPAPDGLNIYEWLLQYKKRAAIVANLSPVAVAGSDVSMVLPSNLLLNGSLSSDPDGTITSYKWRKLTGPASYSFSDSNTVSPTVQNLSSGIYSFELAVTDNKNAVGRDTIFVNATQQSTTPGTTYQILIDAGSNSAGGVTTPSPTNGYYWNNMTDARPGVRITNAVTTINTSSAVTLEVINRIDGTYNTAANGMNSQNSTGAVGIYPASATNDYAFVHNTATNGRWRISGLEANKSYAIKFWGSKSGETSNRDLEIKRSTETVWLTYSAASNTNFNNAAVFNVTGVSSVDFDIRTRAGSVFGYINVIDITWTVPSGPTNQSPKAIAGSDISISLPTDSVVLNGCSSTDPENAALKYKWRLITGPGSIATSPDTVCSFNVNNLVAGSYTFELSVTDTGSLVNKDTVVVQVADPLAWPILPAPLCPQPYKLVILGSSTAFGTGATPIDSSFVNKLSIYIQRQNDQVIVTNLALGGYTTYQVNPSDYVPTGGKPAPDENRNITAALALNPDAIILNLPTNDAASAFTLQETQDNFNRIVAAADEAGVPIWVTTSQPRNNLSANQVNTLVQTRDWVIQRFGTKAIDFWTGIANADGTINTTYSAGDGVHLNNLGHHLLFTRTLNEKIWDTICARRIGSNIPPVAVAGNDASITLPINSISVSGNASSDVDGTITNYSWRKISGPAGATIANASSVQTNINFTTAGVYLYELTVTDNNTSTGLDTITLTVNSAINIAPVARAGVDASISLPSIITVSGNTSTDVDGTITSYAWRKISGPAGQIIANPAAVQTNISFTTAGSYVFELRVTDNNTATGLDSVTITVNPAPNVSPIARAGSDIVITLPVSSTSLSGSASTDADGTVTTYAWRKISGPAGETIASPATVQTNFNVVNAGVYVLELRVTDNNLASGLDSITVTVNDVATALTYKALRVNLHDGTTPFNNTQWNNWVPASNVNSATFKYEDGTQSSIFVNVSEHPRFSDNGANYVPTATACPPQVLRFNSLHTINRTFTVSGLNSTKRYNFEFYASRGFTSNSRSIFRTGAVSDTIDTDFNASDLAKLNNISPDANGRIVFTFSFIGSYHYFAGFTIFEPTNSSPSFSNTANVGNLNTLNVDAGKIELKAYPNPFKDELRLKLNNQKAGDYVISLVDMTGKIIWTKKVKGLQGSINEIIPTHRLNKGIYFLQIRTKDSQSIQKIIKQ